MPHIVIIGGSDAGASAAFRIKELQPQTGVTMLVADAYPGFSICGLPFFLSGEVPDWHTLAYHKVDEFERQGIRLLLNHRVELISPDRKRVSISPVEGQPLEMADALTRRGLAVTVLEFLPEVLSTMDPVMGRLMAAMQWCAAAKP